jgi:hypothetical protein
MAFCGKIKLEDFAREFASWYLETLAGVKT